MIAAENKSSGKYQPYPEYKDSGVEWLGEVPSHWTVTAVKRFASFTTGWTPPTGNDSYFDGPHLWANISDVGHKILSTTAKTITDAGVRATRINKSPKGSLLFSFKLSIGLVSIVGEEMYTNEAIATFLPSKKVNIPYMYWAAPLFIPQNAEENIYGAKLLNQERIKNAGFVLPASSEQQTIAAFLDYETARIDRLIAKQRQLIELLKEKRQAVISHAVTKGLNPGAPMKDSGVEWLGQVPEHWKVGSLRWYLRVSSGEYLSNQHFDLEPSESAIYPVIGGNGVMGYTSHKNQATPLVVGRVGALCGNVHLVDGECWVTDNALLIGLSSKISVNFAAHYLKSLNLNKLANQNTQPLITGTMIKDQNIALPPLHEQSEIVEFVTQEEQKLNLLVAKAEQAIVLMQERRTALISAAVTGKIDLRGWEQSDA